MTDRRLFILSHDQARHNAAQFAKTAPDGWVAKFSEPVKSRDQEEKYHAMIGDISKHCKFMTESMELDDWKRLLVDAFVRVMRSNAISQGLPDPFQSQGRVLPSLDGTGIVQLGIQTRKFRKKIAAEFIEYLYAYGSENNVPWSETSKTAFGETRAVA